MKSLMLAATLVVAAAPVSAQGVDKKLEACRKASAEAESNTDFKCDWKAVTPAAGAPSLTGRYRFIERGQAGDMTLLEGTRPDGPDAEVMMSVSTVSKARMPGTCEFVLRGRRSGDALLMKHENELDCVVTVKRTGTRDVIAVDGNQACSGMCGLGATFKGRYSLRR